MTIRYMGYRAGDMNDVVIHDEIHRSGHGEAFFNADAGFGMDDHTSYHGDGDGDYEFGHGHFAHGHGW